MKSTIRSQEKSWMLKISSIEPWLFRLNTRNCVKSTTDTQFFCHECYNSTGKEWYVLSTDMWFAFLHHHKQLISMDNGCFNVTKLDSGVVFQTILLHFMWYKSRSNILEIIPFTCIKSFSCFEFKCTVPQSQNNVMNVMKRSTCW